MLLDAFDPKSVLDWIQSGGIIGILLFILIAGQRKWWVFGWQFRELEDRYNKVEESNARWMEIALRGVGVTERIVRVVETKDDSAKA